jgi:hypothetical protein
MAEKSEIQNKRNPYEKKLREWEKEITEIENLVHALPSVNIFNLGLGLISQLTSSNKISEKHDQLENIKAGIRKMTETLSQTMSDDLSNPDLDNYLKRIVDLRLKVNRLIKDLSQKDPVKYLQSIVNNE